MGPRTRYLGPGWELAKVRGDTLAVDQLDKQIAESHGRVLDANVQRQIAALRDQYRGRADLAALVERAERGLRSQLDTEKQITREASQRTVQSGGGASFAPIARSLGQVGGQLLGNLGPTGQAVAQVAREVSNLSSGLGGVEVAAVGSTAALLGIGVASSGIAALGGLLLTASKQSAELEKSLEGTRVFGRASLEQLEQYKAQIRRIAEITTKEISEIEKGFAAAAVAGVKQNIGSFVAEAAKGSLLLLGTTEESVRSLDAVLDGFRLPDTEIHNALNTILVGSREAGVGTAEFAHALAAASQGATQLKIPLNDTAAALTAMIKNGAPAAQAGGALETILLRLATPADQASQQIRQLGVELSADAFKKRGAVALFADIARASDVSNPKIKELGGNAASLQASLFGVGRVGQASFAAFANGAKDASDAALKISTDLQAADRSATEIANSSARQIDQVYNRLTESPGKILGDFNELLARVGGVKVALTPQIDVAAVERDIQQIEKLLDQSDLHGAIDKAIRLHAQTSIKEIPGSEKIFEPVRILNEALARTNGLLVDAEGKLHKISEFKIDAGAIVPVVDPEPLIATVQQALKDGAKSPLDPTVATDPLSRSIRQTLAALPPQFLKLDGALAPDSVRDAIKKLQDAVGNSQLFLDPQKQQELQAALEVVRQGTTAELTATKLIDQAQSKTLTFLAKLKSDNEVVVRQMEAEVALQEQLGASPATVAKARESIAAVKVSNTASENAAQLADQRKRRDDLFAGLDAIAKERAAVDAAFRAQEQAVRDVFRGLDKGLVDSFTAEKESLDQTLSDAFAKIVDSFTKAPFFDVDALNEALQLLDEKGTELRSDLSSKQGTELLHQSQDEILRVREAENQLAGTTAQGLGQIALALAHVRAENERAANLTPQTKAKLDDAAARLALKQSGQFLVDLSLRPQFDIDQEALYRAIEEKIKPQAEDALHIQAQIDLAIDQGESTDDLVARLEAVRQKVRELGDAMRDTGEQFRLGFSDGLADAVREFTDQARNGYEAARDVVQSLNNDLSDVLVQLAHGKASFHDFASAVIDDMLRIASQQLSRSILGSALGILGGASTAGAAAAPGGTGLFGFPAFEAVGGVVPGQIVGQSPITASVAQAASPQVSHFAALEPLVRRFAEGGVHPGQIIQQSPLGSSAQLAAIARAPSPVPPITVMHKFAEGGVMRGAMSAISQRSISSINEVARTSTISHKHDELIRRFAEGGIMPGRMMPTINYAIGGVATSPQHAIFAEKPGMAEAFVPLPGVGRGIPVEFKQGQGGGGVVEIHNHFTIHALDSASVEQMLHAQARTIGDIYAAEVATGHNRSIVTANRGSAR